jgi:hypothetical protein
MPPSHVDALPVFHALTPWNGAAARPCSGRERLPPRCNAKTGRRRQGSNDGLNKRQNTL